jgi:c-di-GMP-binding flagellar brake protein YcgR
MNGQLVLMQMLGRFTDPKASRNTFIAIIVIAVAIVLVAVLRRAVGGGTGSGLAGASSSSGFNRRAFRKAARAAGLSVDESRFLEDYGKVLKVTSPEFLFRNQAKLDAFFKDLYRSIEQYSDSEGDADERKAALFEIRERLNQSQSKVVQVTSTRQLGRNMPLSFLVKGDESYPSTVLAVEAGGIAAEPPRDAYGETIRLKRGTKLTCYFYGKGRQGYQFETRVAGWELVGSREVMVIAHSEGVKALPARRHQRKEMRAPCTFYHVSVSTEKVRGKPKQKAKVEKIPYPGMLSDISAGGLGIQSANPLPAGGFVKIEFDTGNGIQSAFGKVVRMNKLRTTGGVMHIQFVKITRRSLNAILSYVYGYAD